MALYTGKDVQDIKKSTEVVITSYEMVKSIIDKKKHLVTDNLTEKETPKFGTIILDESHYIKSHDAARSKNALKICHAGIGIKIAVSNFKKFFTKLKVF